MTIAELLEVLGHVRSAGVDAYKGYKLIKEEEEDLKAELLEKLSEAGLKSAKGDKFQATITSRPIIEITHEQSVLNWLNETPDIESDAYIGLKKIEFKSLALQILKDTGEIVPGTELSNQEILTIRSNKKSNGRNK